MGLVYGVNRFNKSSSLVLFILMFAVWIVYCSRKKLLFQYMLSNCKLWKVSRFEAKLHEFCLIWPFFHSFSYSDITLYFEFIADFFCQLFWRFWGFIWIKNSGINWKKILISELLNKWKMILKGQNLCNFALNYDTFLNLQLVSIH